MPVSAGGVPSMNEEQTEEEVRAEFEALKKQTENDFYRIIGKSISAWAKTEGQLVFIAAMLLDTSLEKAGLVFYSIPNFHSWLSIIEELFAIDPKYSPLRPDWIEIAKRLKKLNDTRVALAHHALRPGKGFAHFAESDDEDFSGVIPTLKPDKFDLRTKSRKHAPIGLEELQTFIHELGTTHDKIRELMDRMEPIFIEPRKGLAETIRAVRQKLASLTPAQIEALRGAPPKTDAG
jgi:hypothetical protein